MTPPPADLLPCRKCGKPLSDGKPMDGIVMSIKDKTGVYHTECWGFSRPQPIAGDGWEEAIEAAARFIEAQKWTAASHESMRQWCEGIRALSRPAHQEKSK